MNRLYTHPYDIICHKVRTDKEPILEQALKFPLPLNVMCVSSRSPMAHKRAVEAFAYYFRREFQYGFVQYDASEYTSNQDTLAFLWTVEHDVHIDISVGACCFRWRDESNQWALQWIWLHPYCRRQGRLSETWIAFKNWFGDFDVEPPLSEAMKRFVDKMNATHRS